MSMYTLMIDDSSLNQNRLLSIKTFIFASFHELGSVGPPGKQKSDVSNAIEWGGVKPTNRT